MESIKKLKEIISMLEMELKAYSELIDLSTMLPKEKFVKYRLSRLINRVRVDGNSLIGIFLKIEPKVEESEREAVKNFIVSYIDSNVRPNDLLFLFENGSSFIGLVCIEEDERAGEVILKRIEGIVKEISLKLPNEKVSDIKWSIRTTKLKPDDDVNSFLGRLKGESA